MASPLSTVPFWVKMILAVILDLGSAGVALLGFALPVLDDMLYMGLQVLFMAVFHNFGLGLLMGVAFTEAIPVINLIPTCSIMTFWNGYRTNWRY